MSTTPPDPADPRGPAPIPPGYRAGDYVPFKDRDPSNPSSIAGQWADAGREAQMGGGRPMTADERYRAIYGYDAPDRVTYASWGRRVLGYLADGFLTAVATIPLGVGYAMLVQDLDLRTDPVTGDTVRGPGSEVAPVTVGVLVIGGLILLGFSIYNRIIRQGRTGYSLGKSLVGIRLVRASNGRPLGAGWCFLRDIAHYVDSLICYLGWLWPLWDSRRQTIADKIMSSVVIVQSPDQAR